MARAYRMTSARRAAIKKAQAASARKRRGKRKKRIAAAVGLTSVGVIGVTMAASRIRKRGAAKVAPVNVVQATVAPSTPEIKYSSSKELDVIRVNFASDGIILRKLTGKNKGKFKSIDFSHVGKPEGSQKTTIYIDLDDPRNRKTKDSVGKTVIKVDKNGRMRKVQRLRPAYDARRRSEYSPAARRAAYERQKARKAEKAARKMNYG